MLRRIIFEIFKWVTLKFKFRDVLKEYNFLKRNHLKSIEHNFSLQKERLFKILDFAINNVPYYKRIAKKKNIKLSKDTIFEDIKQFPILTKDIIRKNWKNLHSELKNKNFIFNTSGGTTGEPLLFIQDEEYLMKRQSSVLVFNEIAGYSLGDKMFYLWGSERDIIRQSNGIIKSLVNKFIKNIHFQNAFKMSDVIIYKYVQEINQIKPKVIIAYVQSIYEIVKFIKRKALKVHPVNSIIVSAGELTSSLRESIESTFKCRVFNRYGSREMSLIALSCEKSDKLHINMHQQFVEILDDFDNPLKEHEKGNIIITNLINCGMPLIRYKIGDLGSLDFSQCPCGRGLIRLDNVYGRIIDIFKTENGDLIYGEFFTHLFYFQRNIKQFKVVQEKLNEINIFLVTNDNNKLSQSIEMDIMKKIHIVMGTNCKVNFKYVSNIDPSSSGKFIYTISKI